MSSHPFTAPAVRPATIRRWKAITTTMMGTVTTIAAAAIEPVGWVNWEAPGNCLARVLRGRADAPVDAADRSLGRALGVHPRVGPPRHLLEDGRHVRLRAGVDVRVVDLEGGVALLEGEPVLVLHLRAERGVAGGRGGQPLHDLGRLPAGLAERDLVALDDRAARRLHE
jgi:hypothetical protein